jgi:hypothetical protein
VYDLGLSSEETGRLTLKEFDALCKRMKIRDKMGQYSNALICCAIYNSQRTSRKQKVLKPSDFIGEEIKKKEPMTSMEMKAALMAITDTYTRQVEKQNGNRRRKTKSKDNTR